MEVVCGIGAESLAVRYEVLKLCGSFAGEVSRDGSIVRSEVLARGLVKF